MVVIVDYGAGNMGSIQNMFKKLGQESVITSDETIILEATKLVLPGVGSFDSAMEKLNALKIVDALNKKVLEEKTPILGICLGMQLLAKKSDEGTLNGLGWIDAEVKKLSPSNLKVPHMGWNIPRIQKTSNLALDLPHESRFYFVHSYYMDCNNQNDVLMNVSYGDEFCVAIEHENIMGVQFHPEKSHVFGLSLLKNFIEKY